KGDSGRASLRARLLVQGVVAIPGVQWVAMRASRGGCSVNLLESSGDDHVLQFKMALSALPKTHAVLPMVKAHWINWRKSRRIIVVGVEDWSLVNEDGPVVNAAKFAAAEVDESRFCGREGHAIFMCPLLDEPEGMIQA
ncbi:hypothetical protein FOZ62_009977, partial [Perkinsus olseni]